jgi:hypothetical protein
MVDKTAAENETTTFEVTTSDAPVFDDSVASDAGKPEGDEVKPEGVKPDGEGEESPGEGETGEGTPEAATDAGEDGKPKRAGRLQKRIDRLTKKAAEAERRAEEAERRARELETRRETTKPKAEEEPDPADFEDYQDYLAKYNEWRAEKKPETRDPSKDQPKPEEAKKPEDTATDDAGKEDPEFQEALEDMEDSFTDAREKFKDFDAVIGAQDVQITRDMVIAMADADDPGAIAYHLGKNKAEAARIAKLSPLAQAREIGKIEVKLQAKPEKPKPKTTEAPDPIEPVGGSDGSTRDVEDMTYSEFEQERNAQETKRKRGFW